MLRGLVDALVVLQTVLALGAVCAFGWGLRTGRQLCKQEYCCASVAESRGGWVESA